MDFLNQAGNNNNTQLKLKKLLNKGYIQKSKKLYLKNLNKKHKFLINFLKYNNIINYSCNKDSNLFLNQKINKKKINFNQSYLIIFLKYFENKPIIF